MKRRFVLIGVVVAVVLLAWAGWHALRLMPGVASADPASRASAPSSSSAPAGNAAPAVPAQTAVTPPGQGSTPVPSVPVVPAPAAPPRVVSRQPPQVPNPAREEAEAIALNLRHFGQRFGGNPVGTNAEIVKVLNGGNPQGARYLPQEHLRLNEQGELLDAFGTPYFFHQLSAEEMEIRSAGPDKTLWTQDDIAVK